MDFAGATGRISFDEKGDRKDAEMTIFTMKAASSADRDHQGRQDRHVRRFRAQSTAPAADVAKK